MKLVLTGVTGAAGIQIFRQAVLDAAIKQIMVLAERALPSWMNIPQNDKTEVVVVQNFLDYTWNLPARLSQYDACVWALGECSVGLTNDDYTRITYDYTIHFVNSLHKAGTEDEMNSVPFRFVFISQEGADPSGKSTSKAIKGKTEEDLFELSSFSNIKVSILRPAYIYPSKKHLSNQENIRSPTARAMDCLVLPIIKTILPFMYTPIDDLGLFALEVAKGKWSDQNLFTNSKIREHIKELRKARSRYPEADNTQLEN